MAQVGRNALCSCGSGRKYKKCCLGKPVPIILKTERVTGEQEARARLAFARKDAAAHQRRLIQGLGDPIMSWDDARGTRFVVVGERVHWGKSWKTFFDFLSYFVKTTMGEAWGNAEIPKLWEHRHPFVQWYDKLCVFQRITATGAPGAVFTGPMTGALRGYYGLAYDLYLTAHNATLPDLLLRRLRNRDQFEGALYEAFVIGSFAKAGFDIEFEDEGDSTRSHCEFTARQRDTGRCFSVECKAVTTRSARAGESDQPPRISDKLHEALGKCADHTRIVFIELNRKTDGADMRWADTVGAELVELEGRLTVSGAPAPPAYVVVTNRSFLHHLDDSEYSESYATFGFKIPDYPPTKAAKSVWAAAQARRHHIEMHYLLKAIGTHTDIPSTFDERLPEETFGGAPVARLRVGERYVVPDGDGTEREGVLEDGTVFEEQKIVYGIYRLTDGRRVICTTPINDAEVALYRKSPDTFFGVLKHVGANHTDPLSFFEAMHEVYVNTPRDRLMEFMKDWAPTVDLAALSDLELSEYYCARMAESAMRHNARAKAVPS